MRAGSTQRSREFMTPLGSTTDDAELGPGSLSRPVGWLDTVAVAALLVEAAVLVVSVRHAMYLPFWYNEQWRAWHISRSIWGELWRRLPQADSPIAAGWLLVEKVTTLAFGEVEAAYRWPVALCLPLFALTSYALARRWLGPLSSYLTVALLVANPLLYNYVWQLAPYLCEAMLAPLVILLWLKATDWEDRPGRRLAAYVGIGACAVVGTALTFLVTPLLAIDLVRSRRTRAWRRLVPPILAGLIVVGHLAIVVLPQSEGAVTESWVRWYAPRSLDALGFAAHYLGAFVARVVPGPIATDRVLAVLVWLTLAAGALMALRDRRVRPLFVALAGALAFQLVASSVRLWAFGPHRINYFLIPLLYLLAAVGLSGVVRLLAGWRRSDLPAAAHWAAIAGLAVLLGVVMTAVTAAGTMSAIGLRDMRRVSLAAHPYDGIRALASAARPYTGPRDVVVFAQHPIYKNFKGWAYYRSAYGGWPQGAAGRVAPPPDRSLQVEGRDRGQVHRFLAAYPDARHVLNVTMANAHPSTVASVNRAFRDAGLRPGRRVEVARTGTLTIWTPGEQGDQ
jgi:Dolichyl-phosphate-mannose-protein mannosyltransferase